MVAAKCKLTAVCDQTIDLAMTGIVAQRIKPNASISYQSVWFDYWLLLIQSLANVSGKGKEDSPTLGALSPTWVSWMELPGFDLTQIWMWLFQPFGEWSTVSGKHLSLSLSFLLSHTQSHSIFSLRPSLPLKLMNNYLTNRHDSAATYSFKTFQKLPCKLNLWTFCKVSLALFQICCIKPIIFS